MKYKNIIFDFGNVIGKFKGDYILGKFASTPEDYDILADAIFKNWVALDAGTIDYDQNAEDTIAGLPDHLKDTARDFFENWFQYVDTSGDMEIHQRIKSPRFRSTCFPMPPPVLRNAHWKIIRS